MASRLALGVPRILSTRVSPSHVKNGLFIVLLQEGSWFSHYSGLLLGMLMAPGIRINHRGRFVGAKHRAASTSFNSSFILRPHKLQQRTIIMTIRRPKCIYVLPAALPGINQIAAAPGKTRLPEQMHQQDIGHQPGMAAIAVGKGMNRRETVMEADCNLVGGIAAMLQPGGGIGAESAQFRGNLPCRHADILAGSPVFSRPAPDVTEHPFMQTLDETIGEDVTRSAAEGPDLGFGDVLLFPAVKFGPRGDMGEQQSVRLIRVERGCPFRVIELHDFMSHKSRGVSRASSSTAASSEARCSSWPSDCDSSSMECDTRCMRSPATFRACVLTVSSSDVRGTRA